MSISNYALIMSVSSNLKTSKVNKTAKIMTQPQIVTKSLTRSKRQTLKEWDNRSISRLNMTLTPKILRMKALGAEMQIVLNRILSLNHLTSIHTAKIRNLNNKQEGLNKLINPTQWLEQTFKHMTLTKLDSSSPVSNANNNHRVLLRKNKLTIVMEEVISLKNKTKLLIRCLQDHNNN